MEDHSEIKVAEAVANEQNRRRGDQALNMPPQQGIATEEFIVFILSEDDRVRCIHVPVNLDNSRCPRRPREICVAAGAGIRLPAANPN